MLITTFDVSFYWLQTWPLIRWLILNVHKTWTRNLPPFSLCFSILSSVAHIWISMSWEQFHDLHLNITNETSQIGLCGKRDLQTYYDPHSYEIVGSYHDKTITFEKFLSHRQFKPISVWWEILSAKRSGCSNEPPNSLSLLRTMENMYKLSDSQS